jgi:hypothetical protein
VVQAILNHRDESVTAVSDRYAMDRKEEQALIAWSKRIEEIVGHKLTSSIVAFVPTAMAS